MNKKLIILPFLAFALAGCVDGPKQEDVKVESVSLSYEMKEISVGESFQLYATVFPENATNKNITWSTGAESVAKVENGLVTGVSAGVATITVKTVDQEKTASCSFVVKPITPIIHVESISVDQTSVSLKVGEKIAISTTVLPDNASDKTVEWETEDESIATVSNGEISAVAEGETRVNVYTNDGNFKASVDVTVTAVTPKPVEETKTILLNAPKYFDKETQPLPPTVIDEITFTWNKNDGAYEPGYFEGKGGSIKLYPQNSVTIVSTLGNIKSINIVYNADKDTPSNPLTPNSGSFNDDLTTWTGNTKSLTLTAGGNSGCKAFTSIEVTYVKNKTHDPIDLGEKTISEVKEYIANAVTTKDLPVNQYGMGVDKLTTVTIKGMAIGKFNTVKTAADHGYNITEPSKVIFGDSTGSIAVASKTGDGTLANKVGDYQMKDTSKYIVTGYISMSLGMPELICTSFTWDKTLDVKPDFSKISKGELTIPQFTETAKNLNYNISGFAYGEAYTLKGLTCYYSEADGSGKTYYNFTDGTNNIRVNAYNIGRISVGFTYDITGFISMENYSPIIVAYSFEKSSISPIDLNEFYKSAEEMNIENLKKINYVNDTDTKYPQMIENYSKIYKTTGYITTVEQGGNYYLSISDKFIDTKDFINGKGESSTKYNLALIKNNNFWNIDDPYGKYNPYSEVTDADEKVTVYYIPRHTAFYDKKMYWEILLIPQSIPTQE